MLVEKQYDGEAINCINQSVLMRQTLLDDSLASTVFDQRHGVKNITVGKKKHPFTFLASKNVATSKVILEIEIFYSRWPPFSFVQVRKQDVLRDCFRQGGHSFVVFRYDLKKQAKIALFIAIGTILQCFFLAIIKTFPKLPFSHRT